jgi:endonuclease/exonuclease/phosphatase family metal-dependent hydrolase
MQVEMLLGHAAIGDERPVVLMGDFNEWRRQRRSALKPFAGFAARARGGELPPISRCWRSTDHSAAASSSAVWWPMTAPSPASGHLPVKARIRSQSRPRMRCERSTPRRPVPEGDRNA